MARILLFTLTGLLLGTSAFASLGTEVSGEVVQISSNGYKVKTAHGTLTIQKLKVPEEIRKSLEMASGHFSGFVPKDAVDKPYFTDRKVGVRK